MAFLCPLPSNRARRAMHLFSTNSITAKLHKPKQAMGTYSLLQDGDMSERGRFTIKVRIYRKASSLDRLFETPRQRSNRLYCEAQPINVTYNQILTLKTKTMTFEPSEIPQALRCSHLWYSQRCDTGKCYLMEPGGKGYWIMKCDNEEGDGCDGHLYTGKLKKTREVREGLKEGKWPWETYCFGKQKKRIVCIEPSGEA